MSDRQHIADALHAMRGVDMALCDYAASGDVLTLDNACAAARRLRRALAQQRRMINGKEVKNTMAKKIKKPVKGGKGKPC